MSSPKPLVNKVADVDDKNYSRMLFVTLEQLLISELNADAACSHPAIVTSCMLCALPLE
jgi:hypothetical protein